MGESKLAAGQGNFAVQFISLQTASGKTPIGTASTKEGASRIVTILSAG
jgi:hypothetical protein